MRSDDTGAWFERRLREPSFVIPEIADFRRQRADARTAAGRAQRGTAREREGAFGNAAITAEVRYSLLAKHYHSRTASASLGSASVTSARKSYSARSEMSVGSRLTTTRVAPRSAAVRGSEAAGSTVREEPITT